MKRDNRNSAGRLRVPVDIQYRPSDGSTDAMGNVQKGEWTSRGVFYAEIRERRGHEKLDAGRQTDIKSAVVRFRDEGQTIKATDELVFRDERWDIRSITRPDDSDRWIECLCDTQGTENS